MAHTNLSAFPVSDFPEISLGDIQIAIGEKLIEADVLRMQIEALQYSATSDRMSQFYAFLAFGLLIGSCIGCAIIARL